MNVNLYFIIAICFLSSLCDRNTRLYFGSFGFLMLGHYCATLPVPAEHFDYAYLSSAFLCVYLALSVPRIKSNLLIFLVCGSCVFINCLGFMLWEHSLNVGIYDDLYSLVYITIMVYLLPRAYHAGIRKGFDKLDFLWGVLSNNLSKRVGNIR